jgi:exodeoxyribonuclease V beta subunit
VTRARHLCVLTWGWINRAETSALAWLLYPSEAGDPPFSAMGSLCEEDLLEGLGALAAEAGGAIGIDADPFLATAETVPHQADPPVLAARAFAGRIPRDWRLTSYSGLVAGADVERPDYDFHPPPDPAATPPEPVDPVFAFPRGPGPGQCLHELLEAIDFTAADRLALKTTVRLHLDRHAIDGAWGSTVERLVDRVLDTCLDGEDLCLRRIGRENRRDEMAFHYPLARLDSRGLGSVLARFPAYQGAGTDLVFDPLVGLMKGFIDLVFRHRGRYFIVDYKSNHLGDQVADYRAERLGAAMAAHRYDLQYLVYSVALHRFLSSRLAGYDYRRHFGGVYYLFLRGMRPARGPACGVFFDCPDPDLIRVLDDFFAGRGVTPVPQNAL